MNFLIKLLGGITEDEYNAMYSNLSNRFKKEWEDKKQIEEKFIKCTKIALDLASKLKDQKKIKEIYSL